MTPIPMTRAWSVAGLVESPVDGQMVRTCATAMREAWYELTSGKNVALGKSYKLAPMPDWVRTTGPSDLTDLTDGRLASRVDDAIWRDQMAVGWDEYPLVHIQLDLGKEYPVDKVVLRVFGGEQESFCFPRKVTLLASSNGGDFYYVDEWCKYLPGDEEERERFVYLPEEGSGVSQGGPERGPGTGGYVYPVTFKDLKIKARYIGLVIETHGRLFMDEIAVIEGDHSAEEVRPNGRKVPFSTDGVWLFHTKGTLWVCNNLPIFDHLRFWDVRETPSPRTFVLELPEGVEVDLRPALSVKDPVLLRHEKVVIDNRKYNRYEFSSSAKTSPSQVPYVTIWLTTDWPEGQEGEAYLYAKWEGGQQPKIELPVRSYSIKPARVPKRLHTSISYMSESFQFMWPDFFKTYRALGFNAVPFHPTSGLQLDWVKKARDEGFQILCNENPFYPMQGRYGENPEMYVQYADGTVNTHQVSLAYRGQYYQKELERMADLAASLKPDWVFFDNELWNEYWAEARKDTLLMERMKKEGLATIEETVAFLGREISRDLYNAWTAWAGKGDKKPLVGQWAAVPWEHSSRNVFYFTRCYPDYMNFAMPDCYYGGSPTMVENDVYTCRLALPRGDIIPWITPGLFGEFPSRLMRDMILQAFFNGSRGVTIYPIGGYCDGLDLKYTSEAISIAAKVEDIIMDGSLVDTLRDLTSPDPDLRLTGLQLENGEAAILVSNYAPSAHKKPHTVRYGVKVRSQVVDLDTDEVIAWISPEEPTFTVSFPPGTRTKAFHVRPGP